MDQLPEVKHYFEFYWDILPSWSHSLRYLKMMTNVWNLSSHKTLWDFKYVQHIALF